MKVKKIKTRFFTLIEMMIVLSIISLLLGVLGYRYASTLDEGKAFKTKFAMERLSGILNLKSADDPSFLSNIPGQWLDVATNSPLVNNVDSITRDGWGNLFEVNLSQDGSIEIHSKKYEDYLKNNRQSLFNNSGSRQ
ncbi:MAG: prepilin-type N-terminal cleavage/methylation domain-containing protein [Parachlamydiaceae bacterium]|nr:prepilin-type N-terminal cleavage/methylation domain-containing protein [Parachlamydiaceae bacterium]